MVNQRLISADEALADARGEDGYEKHEDGMGEIHYSYRPSPDHQRAAPFHLARAQLDQLVDLLRVATGVHNPLVLTEQAICALRRLAYGPRREAAHRGHDPLGSSIEDGEAPAGVDPDTGVVNDGHWDFELDVVRDGLKLRQALERVGYVTYAFAVDGSVSFEAGPCYPAAEATLGLQGNEYGELVDDPKQVFEAAVRATRAAAEILAASPLRA